MAESVDALVSNTSGATHPGSSPGLGTRFKNHLQILKDKFSLSDCKGTKNNLSHHLVKHIIQYHPISTSSSLLGNVQSLSPTYFNTIWGGNVIGNCASS